MSATAFETKGIIGHGGNSRNLISRRIRGKVIEQNSLNENPVFTKRGLRCHRARAGDGKFAFS